MMTTPLSSPGVVALAWTAAPPVDALPGWVAMFTVQPVRLVQAMRLAWTRHGALPPVWPAARRTTPPSNRPHSSVGGARRRVLLEKLSESQHSFLTLGCVLATAGFGILLAATLVRPSP